MPPGRKPNLDKRIADLVSQLKAALVAREQQRIERAVAVQVDSLVLGLSKTASSSKLLPLGSSGSGDAGSGQGNRKPRSEASKAAQAAKMKAYWKARKAAEAKGGKVKKAAGAPASETLKS